MTTDPPLLRRPSLRDYVQHKATCAKATARQRCGCGTADCSLENLASCTCGLDALLADASPVRAEPEPEKEQEKDLARPPSVVSDEQATAGTNEADRS